MVSVQKPYTKASVPKPYERGSPPTVSIITHLVNVIKAADYLGLDDLKSYITHTLAEVAHNFHCYCSGCAVLLPKMLDTVYHESIVPRSLLDNLVKILGQTKAVQKLWRIGLITMSPEATSHLLTHMLSRIRHDQEGGTLAAFALYVALAKLHRQVCRKSRDPDAWEGLLGPLMKDILPRLLAADLCWCESPVLRKAAGLDVDIIQGLVQHITSSFMARETCENIWGMVSNRKLEFWDEQAMKSVVEWFKKEWLSLSITPPEPDPRMCASPPPGGGGGVVAKAPRMKEPYEPNFFATWNRRDLALLGQEMGVEVEDLLARGHRAGLPPRTPRRSMGNHPTTTTTNTTTNTTRSGGVNTAGRGRGRGRGRGIGIGIRDMPTSTPNPGGETSTQQAWEREMATYMNR